MINHEQQTLFSCPIFSAWLPNINEEEYCSPFLLRYSDLMDLHDVKIDDK